MKKKKKQTIPAVSSTTKSVQKFRAALLRQGLAASSVSDYCRWVTRFLLYCAENKNSLEKLPRDAAERFYLSMGYPAGAMERNVPTSALRAFSRFAVEARIPFSPIEFPKGFSRPRPPRLIPRPSENEKVNHPRHYNTNPFGVECIDVVEHMSFNVGNAVKYLWRADEKGSPIEDLRKAAWYIEREITKRQKESK